MGLVRGDAIPNATRKRLKTLKWAITVFFLVLGFATLAAYIKIGIEHAPQYGAAVRPCRGSAISARQAAQ